MLYISSRVSRWNNTGRTTASRSLQRQSTTGSRRDRTGRPSLFARSFPRRPPHPELRVGVGGRTPEKKKGAQAGAKGKSNKQRGNRKPSFPPPLTVSHAELLVDGSDDRFRQMICLFVEQLGRMNMCRETFGRSIDLPGSQFAVPVGVAHRHGNRA
jgi:hypothetical protein